MTVRRRGLVLVLAVAALGGASCGGLPSSVTTTDARWAADACSAFRTGVRPAALASANAKSPTEIQRVAAGQSPQGDNLANPPYVTMVANAARASVGDSRYLSLNTDVTKLVTDISRLNASKLTSSLSTIRQDTDQIAGDCKVIGD